MAQEAGNLSVEIHGMRGMAGAMQRCIEACVTCHTICLQTVLECLNAGGSHAEPQHIRLLQDCAQICATSADFMLRQSPLHADTCRACAVVCDECARDCQKIGMSECRSACEQCAEECRKMAAH